MVDGSATIDWWAGGAGVLLGAVIGGCIPLVWMRRLRQIERRGELAGMLIELRIAYIDMNALLSDRVLAPLYRLPLTLFKQALPKLIGEKGPTLNQMALLVEYVNRAEELNRGLDRAGEAAGAELAAEFSRNCLKAQNILYDPLQRHENQSLWDGAMTVIQDIEDADKDSWWGSLFAEIEET